MLLDYETNGDVEDMPTPLSHAALVKRYLEDDWPAEARVSERRAARVSASAITGEEQA